MVFAGILTKVSPCVIKSGKNKGQEMGFLGFTGVNGSTLECVVLQQGVGQGQEQAGGLERNKVYIAGEAGQERVGMDFERHNKT
jgi:hypothetical protein